MSSVMTADAITGNDTTNFPPPYPNPANMTMQRNLTRPALHPPTPSLATICTSHGQIIQMAQISFCSRGSLTVEECWEVQLR
ncbi:MAG: hypothetical protein ACREA7_06990 [Nitrosotalea sp.]